MKRVVSIWLPNWSLQRRYVEQPELREHTIVIRSPQTQRGFRVVGCCERARVLGVKPGVPLAEAVALVGPEQARRLTVLEDSAQADRAGLQRLAEWCQRYTPLVSIEEADRVESLFLDVTGCLLCFRGEHNLISRVQNELGELGLDARIAIAATPGAAWALARFAASFNRPLIPASDSVADLLRRLPIEALRLPDEPRVLLRELGIEFIDQLQRLPADEVASRIGPSVVQRLSQATGGLIELTIPHRVIPVYQAEHWLEYPIDRLEAVIFMIERLAQRLAESLPAQRGLQQFFCQLSLESTSPIEIIIDLARPSATPARWLQLLRLRLEAITLEAPINGITLRALALAPLECRQTSLFDNTDTDTIDQFADLVERLASRLGSSAVLAPRLLADAQPEYAVSYKPYLQKRPGQVLPSRVRARGRGVSRKSARSGAERSTAESFPNDRGQSWRRGHRAPAPAHTRPISLLPKPVPIHVTSLVPDGPPGRFSCAAPGVLDGSEPHHTLTRAWGPERIETAWWRGSLVERDYFRVETTRGHRFWIFRRPDGRWFLHGSFD